MLKDLGLLFEITVGEVEQRPVVSKSRGGNLRQDLP